MKIIVHGKAGQVGKRMFGVLEPATRMVDHIGRRVDCHDRSVAIDEDLGCWFFPAEHSKGQLVDPLFLNKNAFLSIPPKTAGQLHSLIPNQAPRGSHSHITGPQPLGPTIPQPPTKFFQTCIRNLPLLFAHFSG
jgi:hypothetical protein